MGSIPASQHLAGEQDGFARLPVLYVFRGHRIEVHATHVVAHFPGDFRPVFQARRRLQGRSGTIQGEMRVASRSTVRDDGHRLIGSVRWVILDLNVQNGGQATQPLGTDTQIIHLVEQLKTQFLGSVRGTARFQVVDIDRIQQGFLGHFHRLFGGTANTNAQHARRAPASPHLRNHFKNPIDNRIGRVQHRELGLGL